MLKKHLTEAEAKSNTINLELIETFDIEIPENNSCSVCQSVIAKEDLTFYCHECKLFFCVQCEKAKKDKSGFEALVHREHYLVAFKNPKPENLKNIEKYKLGNNLFAQMQEEDLTREHCFRCNGFDGCKDTENFNERFICLNCRPGAKWGNGYIDFCGECFEKFCETGEKPQKAPEHLNDHIYLQLVYAGGYYDNY